MDVLLFVVVACFDEVAELPAREFLFEAGAEVVVCALVHVALFVRVVGGAIRLRHLGHVFDAAAHGGALDAVEKERTVIRRESTITTLSILQGR